MNEPTPLPINPLVVANWKMNGLNEKSRELLTQAVLEHADADNVVICPPFTALWAVGDALGGKKIRMGAQDCHWEECGAYTGDISAAMVRNTGADFVIVGHSERRAYHGETDDKIAQKAAAAHRDNLISIICIGESEEEREQGNTLKVIEKQLQTSIPECATCENTFLAYEPIWAIGTGKSATAEQIKEVHAFITDYIATHHTASFEKQVHALYGGSVKPDNASAILRLPHVGGLLVGGASLDKDAFFSIIEISRLIEKA